MNDKNFFGVVVFQSNFNNLLKTVRKHQYIYQKGEIITQKKKKKKKKKTDKN